MISLIYIIWIGRFFLSWRKKQEPLIKRGNTTGFSIVIAIRNEEKNIKPLLESLSIQDYPISKFEIIIIDDHSTDKSKEIIESFKKEQPSLSIRYVPLEKGKQGKKAALYKAYQLAQNDMIITTDGDIKLPKKWLSLTDQAFTNSKIKMVLGGVKIKKTKHLIGNFQALELLSLIASGGAAAILHHPIMSNGANLAFRKNILKDFDFDRLQPQTSSGDDMFLMLETKKIFGAKSIKFLKNEEHFVQTDALSNWKSLINQRIRWVSKSNHYKDPFLLATSWVVFLQNLLLPILIGLSFLFPDLLQTLWPIWFLKVIIDYIFLFNACRFTSQNHLLKHYFLMAFIYPFFISYTAIMGQFSSFNWKGRQY